MKEFVEPLGMRVLIRKDESRTTTRGGIVLPDQAEIPTITGRVVEVSLQIERDADFPIEKYDKVLFHPKNSIPVDFEQDNLLYVVPIEDVVAVFRRHDDPQPRRRGKTGREDDTPERPRSDSGLIRGMIDPEALVRLGAAPRSTGCQPVCLPGSACARV